MEIQSTFSVAAKFTSNGMPITRFKSSATGLTSIMVGVPGPLVSGCFALATEAHDNDGLPHTLEHLIFLGSDTWPWKGVIDLVSNRCFAQGTNAWTDVDHTAYTITTAGAEAFLNIMPIFV